MKKLLVTLMATASLSTTPIAFGGTQVIEVKDKGEVEMRSVIHNNVEVTILRFDDPISNLRNKIEDFEKSQSSGTSYSIKEAVRFFTDSEKIFVEFNKSMAEIAGSSGRVESWHRTGVPVSSVTENGRSKTITNKTVVVQTGASAFVSVSNFDAASRAKVVLNIHQIVPTAGTDVISYFGSSNATLRGGEILPLFWNNNGIQYCALLTLHTSNDKI
ncbi:hypothetical protein [Pseudomonas sp. KCJK9111]|uniref:hypothetical protein n=1 Tax=Pseudomonas sp. KCJK9111 TaxID=3344555 RepID=UPI003905A02C